MKLANWLLTVLALVLLIAACVAGIYFAMGLAQRIPAPYWLSSLLVLAFGGAALVFVLWLVARLLGFKRL